MNDSKTVSSPLPLGLALHKTFAFDQHAIGFADHFLADFRLNFKLMRLNFSQPSASYVFGKNVFHSGRFRSGPG